MDLTGEFRARSDGGERCREATGLESLHLGDELRQLPPDNVGGFTALLELPPTQAVNLLRFTDSPSSSSQAAAVTGIAPPPLHSYGTLTFPSNSLLMERAARFSTEHQQNGNVSGTSSVPSNSSVKTEPAETDSSQAVNNRSGKRKDSDKKVRVRHTFGFFYIRFPDIDSFMPNNNMSRLKARRRRRRRTKALKRTRTCRMFMLELAVVKQQIAIA